MLVAAVGMTLVILCRQIDISVGSQFCICGVVAGLLAKAGLPMPLVALATLLAGAVMGAVNGVLVAGLGLPSIVVTLATLVILRESLRYVREGEFVRDLPPGFQWFGLGQATGQWLVVGDRPRGLRGVRLGPAEPGGGAGGLRHRLGPRGGPAGRHPAPARGLRRVRRDGGAGRAGCLLERRPVRRRRSQRPAPGWNSR